MIRCALKGNVKMPQMPLSTGSASGLSKLRKLAVERRGHGGDNLFRDHPFAG
jgi:hypothetical protein